MPCCADFTSGGSQGSAGSKRRTNCRATRNFGRKRGACRARMPTVTGGETGDRGYLTRLHHIFASRRSNRRWEACRQQSRDSLALIATQSRAPPDEN